MSSEAVPPGDVFVVSAPSGSGKTTICRRLLDEVERLRLSISYTTRRMKPGERHGTDYFFVDPAEFDKMQESKEFLESASVYGNRYGTARKAVLEIVGSGDDVLLEIDVQGGCSVKRAMPEVVLVAVFPPSWETLRSRLFDRGRDSREEMDARLSEARSEMRVLLDYDYMVVNDDLDRAVADVAGIVRAHRLRRARARSPIEKILFQE
jgi:guanylate kinase